MDHTSEDCQNMFTQDQADRMHATFLTTRASLLVSDGCTPVGCTLATSIVGTNETCVGANDGSANLTVTLGTTPYTFAWSTGATTEDVSGLAPASYTVTVTDAAACVVTDGVTITAAAAILSTLVPTNTTCGGCSDGSIDLTASGGAAPLTFIWSNGATTEDISALLQGTYTVTITDNNGCTDIDAAFVSDPLPCIVLSVSTSATNVSCNGGNDGSTTAIPSGGTAPYTYSWDDPGLQTTVTATGLVAGSYSVTVTDAVGCSNVIGSGGKQNYTPASTYNTFYGAYNLSLLNDSNYNAGTIWGPGTPIPYEVSMTFSSATLIDSVRLRAGQYNGDYWSPLSMQLYLGTSGGTLLTTITPTYSMDGYSFTNTLSGTLYTWVITPSGSYSSIREIECYTTGGSGGSTNVTEPASSLTLSTTVQDATCVGCTDGSIDLTVSGGTSPYTYAWSNAATTQDITGLGAGIYSVTVTDNNGCTSNISATVDEATCSIPTTTSSVNATCNGLFDGSGTVSVTGGGPLVQLTYTPTSSYNTFYGVYNLTYLNDGDLSDGSIWGAGTPNPYEITLTFDSVIVLDYIKLKSGQFNGNYNKPVLVTLYRGTSGGTLLATFTPGYSLDTYNFSNTVASTVYTLVVTPAANGYSSIREIECYGNVSGGGYTYLWDAQAGGQTTATATALTAGTYNVTVFDTSGCSAITIVTVSETSGLTLTMGSTDATCNGCVDGIATVSASGGGGGGNQQTYTPASTYNSFYSTWDLSLINDADIDVGTIWSSNTPDPYEMTMTFPTAVSLDTVKLRGGQFNGNYHIPSQMKLYRGTSSGVLLSTITPTDFMTSYGFVNGGSDTLYTWVISPNATTYSSIREIEAYSSSGSSYSYIWDDIAFQTTSTAGGLASGTYNVTVTDIIGCIATGSVFVDQPPLKTSENGSDPEAEAEPDPDPSAIKEHGASLQAAIYPNPTAGLVNIRLENSGVPRDGIVQLYDLYGKLLFVEEFRFSSGSSDYAINFTDRVTYGIYFLKILVGEDEVLRQKLIIASHHR